MTLVGNTTIDKLALFYFRKEIICNSPSTKAALPSRSVGVSTRTHITLLTLLSSLRVKG
jgi:hypothetical protein